jgi:hypothetical protein
MVRPEVRAIESQRTALKRNFRQIQECTGRFQIQTSDTPVFVALLRSAQNVNGAAKKGMSANLGSNVILLQDISASIEFEDTMLMPLAQVDVAAVIAQIGPGKLRTRNSIGFGESAIDRIAPKIPVIRRPFPEVETESLTS